MHMRCLPAQSSRKQPEYRLSQRRDLMAHPLINQLEHDTTRDVFRLLDVRLLSLRLNLRRLRGLGALPCKSSR